ncbi:preprotein translocase subunit SecA [Pedobacter psychrotolerans]|uniref:Protein translocase subunit SecA n=1 Tax=Pedobacter psychrotolerans TaxID=1843235 RepID=A0A4R2HKT8_9SPHI|nr:preprotein translocase subunit SecA [Pedobacter psychrotolerans]TCO29158.1 preprotein translocase subunit SecA [Pedobacter psychrotolerans]GGE54641.1 protein translocase subunit SecA [Pedobacter psychrotolerans]
MLGFLAKVFGSKSERDIKAIQPLVVKINEEYSKLSALSNDELRGKTIEFKGRISAFLTEIDGKISALKADAESEELDLHQKTAIYDQVDALGKDRDAELEKVLLEILPEAFAVVKETSRRLSENDYLEVTATQFDRDYAARKSNVKIVGDKAQWANRWDAAGTEVVWNMVHYDVQLIGGIVLHSGKIAEMATGEGKTLVSTLPAYLNALAGQGVHIVTVNDYLARRDSEWNGPLFEFHGLSVDCIDKHEPNSEERRKAYASDITYGTNNEFGFDYLRDNMSQTPDQLVQRKQHFAMVDEVDSVLIDDARTPLIISGPIPHGDQHEFYELKPRIERLVNAQKAYVSQALNEAKKLINAGNSGTEEGEGGLALLRAYRGLPKNKALIKFLSESGVRGLLLKTENYYMADQSKNMPKVDSELFFYIDEKNNQVELTEKGIELITQSGEDPHFFVLPDVGTEVAELEKSDLPLEEKVSTKDALMRDYSVKAERIHSVNQLLKAYTLFEIDVEYIIDEGKIKIVDEQTGRIMDGRRYSDGLHQAIEAKENVKVEDATQTYATVTLQNYFRMYHKLCGMTGTATTEAGEFWSIYKLDVVEIPTNRNISRRDEQDYVYRTVREKYNAVADEIVKLTQAGRPVLVGTTSVEISELLSRMLKLRGIKHNVLNAKMHQREADIVAEAGQSGTVTIATNMAGRGTDIKLGAGVKEAGGLAIVGTERHESRRVDRQLRGRAGRQGDPGSSQFFVSLEDNLMRLFGSERISGIMVRMGIEDGEVIQHSMITKSIERAQKKVEENNFGIRKRLLEYDDVMNSQRTVIYAKRKNALFGERLDVDMNNMVFDVAEDIVTEYKEEANYDGFKLEVIKNFSLDTAITEKEFASTNAAQLSEKLFEEAEAFYARKSEAVIQQSLPVLTQVYEERGELIEQIVVPFTDGIRGIQVAVDLKKAIDNKGKEVVRSFEKTIVLALIDDSWKEHLREMDDLKQSVQNAVYEQKDPLVIYKMEAFNLFKSMLNAVNKEVVSFLYKGGIPVQQEAEDLREAPAPVKQPKLQTTKQEFGREEPGIEFGDTREAVPQQPIRKEATVGRNELCPCGSGKKYKNCHGANL